MNSRIKELAQQADPEYTGEYDNEMGHALVGNEAIQKFAELIVRECAHKLVSFAVNRECQRYDVEIPEYVEGTVYGLKHGAELIKQHFGVEE